MSMYFEVEVFTRYLFFKISGVFLLGFRYSDKKTSGKCGRRQPPTIVRRSTFVCRILNSSLPWWKPGIYIYIIYTRYIICILSPHKLHEPYCTIPGTLKIAEDSRTRSAVFLTTTTHLWTAVSRRCLCEDTLGFSSAIFWRKSAQKFVQGCGVCPKCVSILSWVLCGDPYIEQHAFLFIE